MARMHSRKHGQSGSTNLAIPRKPHWLRYNEKEVELLIVKLFKQGNSPSKIGLILRDSYGIPNVKVITGRKIVKILEQKGLKLDLPEDLKALIKKYVKVATHYNNNHHDITSKRGIQLTRSKIDRLVNYYKKSGKLPKDWKLDFEKAALYL